MFVCICYNKSMQFAINYRNLLLYYREKFIFMSINISLIVIILSVVLILVRLSRPGLITLHYDIIFGIDQVGPWYYSLRAPLAAFIVTILNFVIGYFLFAKNKYLSYYLCLLSSLSSVIVLMYLAVLSSFTL